MAKSQAVTRAFEMAFKNPSQENVLHLQRCWIAYTEGLLDELNKSVDAALGKVVA